MTNLNIDLTLVVPVYNNADTLEELYLRIHQIMSDKGITFELLFVNDAGPDNSLEILCDMFERYVEVSVVNMKSNIGQHAAVLHGLHFARGECCVVMDADLQDPPEALLSLWYARSAQYKAIFAGRRGNYQGFSRMLSSRIYKMLLHFITGLPKDAGIFVLLEREMINAILSMPVKIPWINVLIALSRLPLCVVPIRRQLREKGVSAYTSWARFRSAMQGMYCALSYYLCQSEKSYLESLSNDPVDWVRMCQR